MPSPELRPAVVGSWLPLLSVALALALAGLARHPWRLIALLATLAPFGAALRGASSMVEVEPRFLARLAIVAAVLLLLTTGSLPSWFGPRAGWRHRWVSTIGEVHLAMSGQLPEGEPDHVLAMHRTRHDALRRDAGDGGYTGPAEEAR
ncbi:MAG: hypothetical protein QGH45_16665 [Myxococcota bacterium]|nr:hypothetical protein [Myxococcota bacterium]